MKVSVVIPTISGREESLKRTVEAYESTVSDLDLIVVHGAPSCGVAWQLGAEQALGDYLHLSADDIEPLPGWLIAAAAAVRWAGTVPAARVWRPDGSLESGVAWERDGSDGDPAGLCQVPFCTMEQWESIGPMVPIQYYSDNWFTERARSRLGLECRLVEGYEFLHHRPAGPRPGEIEQQVRDREAYERYLREGYDG